jgi:hypothetical protein
MGLLAPPPRTATHASLVSRTANPLIIIAGIKHASFNGHSYFFSWDFGVTRDINVTWFQARNICRRHCMDTVSIGTYIYHQTALD